jgi:uncharacterized protein YsxB (DUF464 family)
MLEAEYEVALADEAEAEGHREAEEDSVVHQEVVAAGVSVVLPEVVDVVDLVAHQEAHQEDEEVSEVEGSDVELLLTRARSMIWNMALTGRKGYSRGRVCMYHGIPAYLVNRIPRTCCELSGLGWTLYHMPNGNE